LQRYRNKADELGIAVVTVRKWVRRFRESGEAGLLDGRSTPIHDAFRGVDPRWLETCREVIDEHVDQSTPSKAVVLRRVEARLAREYGEGAVKSPARTKAYEVLGAPPGRSSS
jgi:transposase